MKHMAILNYRLYEHEGDKYIKICVNVYTLSHPTTAYFLC